MQKTISNAFENASFGDLKYGLLGSVPTEMLHVSGTGLLKLMFGCLHILIGGPNSKKKDKESFDDLHRCLVRDAEQQSERDFPRMSIRNEITDGTKCADPNKLVTALCYFVSCTLIQGKS